MHALLSLCVSSRLGRLISAGCVQSTGCLGRYCTSELPPHWPLPVRGDYECPAYSLLDGFCNSRPIFPPSILPCSFITTLHPTAAQRTSLLIFSCTNLGLLISREGEASTSSQSHFQLISRGFPCCDISIRIVLFLYSRAPPNHCALESLHLRPG